MSSRDDGGAPTSEPGAAAGASVGVNRAAVLLSAGLLIAAVAQGVLWARFAPGTPYQVRSDGFGALPTTTNYRFAAAALFALSGVVIGVTAAVGTWSARRVRGVPMLVVLVLGSAAGAVLAWGVGAWLAPGTDPAQLVGVDPAVIVTGHPTTGTWLVTLAQPTAAAAVFTLLAAWNGQPDMGAGRLSPRKAAVPPGGSAVPHWKGSDTLSGDGKPRTDPSPGIHAQ